jgi:hypothetical protein
MIQAGIHHQAMQDRELLLDVITNKKRYFRSSWAKYEEAIPGTLTIYPNEHLLKYLTNDYKNMNVMIFGEVPDFENIIEAIKKFEKEMNNL